MKKPYTLLLFALAVILMSAELVASKNAKSLDLPPSSTHSIQSSITLSLSAAKNASLDLSYLPEQKVKQLPYQSLLQHEFINHIQPLSNGLLLFSSQSGSFLFDGYDFVALATEDFESHSALNTETFAALEDRQGNLWVATSLGLYLRDAQSELWQNMSEVFFPERMDSILVKEIYQDSQGRLWFGLLNGIAIYSPETRQLEYTVRASNSSNDIGRVFTIIEQSSDTLWIGSNSGLYQAQLKQQQWQLTEAIEKEYITSSTRFSENEIWFGSDISGIIRLNTDKGQFTTLKENPLPGITLVSSNVWGLLRDSQGLLWISYWDQGVSLFDLSNQRHFRLQHRVKDASALPGHSVEHITEDLNGNIWFATTSGAAVFSHDWLNIQYLRDTAIQLHSPDTNYINHATEDSNGIVWLVSNNNLLAWNPSKNQLKSFYTPDDSTLIDRNIWQIKPINKQHLLLTSSSGVWIFNTSSKLFKPLTSATTYLANDNQRAFYAIAHINDHEFYLASSSADIYLVDTVKESTQLILNTRANPIASHVEYFTRIKVDSRGLLWLASPNGVFWFDPKTKKLTSFSANKGNLRLSSNIIHDILEDPQGNIWLATDSGGLNKIEFEQKQPVNVKVYSKQDGLPSNKIVNLIPGENDFFWFSTDNLFGRYFYETNDIELFPQIGHAELAFNANCWSKSISGYITLCGNEAVRFHPNNLQPISPSSKLVLTSIYRMHQIDSRFSPLKKLENLAFSPEDDLITFRFSTLDFTYSDTTKYQYRLQNYDDTWLNPGFNNFASYTDLPAGHFSLWIKTSIEGQTWQDPVKILDFDVLPPWWQTSTAYTFYLLSIFLIAAAIYRERKQKRRQKEAALEAIKQSEERLRDVLWGSGDQLWRWDIIHNLMFRTEKITLNELPRESIYDWSDVFAKIHNDDRALVSDLIEQHLNGDTEYYEAQFRLLNEFNHKWEWVLMKGRIVERDNDGLPTMLAGTLKNIDDLKQTEERLRYLANYDQLTELPNRTLFLQQMTHAIQAAKRFDEKVALLFFDLNGFKVINDSLGHAIGDLLLKAVAQRLKLILRESDHVARLGGDEFTIIIERVHSKEDIIPSLERIHQELKQPFDLGSQTVLTTASIGVALYPDHGNTAEALLKNADIAMYEAKRNDDKSYCFFEEEMNAQLVRRLNVEKQLENAIANDEFISFFQPRVDVINNQISGFEALIRWRHPERGLVSPAEFIPVAEDSGQIIYLGSWILFDACKQCAKWHQQGHALRVSVNIAALQFKQSDLINIVQQALETSQLKPEYLELEITEGTLIYNLDHTRRVLYDLKQLGVKIALDDFGTGYSSLSYLQQLPIDVLKIDRSFIIQLTESKKSARLCQAIINMAHSLDLEVVAEGIETQEQLNILAEMGCEQYQGYLFGKPLPASDIILPNK
jgi:diguanylate cyclase (GGDEF)-like protein